MWQLQRKDITEVEVVWCISINDDASNQHIKALTSKRLIPIHRQLLNIEFIEYCLEATSNSEDMIFPELIIRNDRDGHAPSKWFGRVKNEVISNSEKKSFHSFRHTFIDYMFNRLKLQGNPIFKALVGHTDNKVTSGIYGSKFEMKYLNKVIQQIDFRQFGITL